MTESRKRPGRKEIPLDLDTVQKLASIGCTNDEIALVLGIDRATFYRRLKRGKGAKALCDALEKGRAEGRASLRRKQMEMALRGNPTMLVWLGKQLLGQRDRVAAEVAGPEGAAVPLHVDHALPADQIAELVGILVANGAANGKAEE